ncbi:hypothetical protein EDF65_2285 [Chryseobacterium nakagawai]|nr:hypothetical protein EDF65_2285 [Chryseobacterium nakagawai]
MLKYLKISIEQVFEFVNLIIFLKSYTGIKVSSIPLLKEGSKIFLLFNSNFWI